MNDQPTERKDDWIDKLLDLIIIAPLELGEFLSRGELSKWIVRKFKA